MEIIDVDNNVKMKCLVMFCFRYGDGMYVVYSVKRDNSQRNIFISKLVVNSEGYTMDSNFTSDEREALERVVAKIINCCDRQILLDDGVKFSSDVKFSLVNKFSSSKCYVATYDNDVIEKIMKFYGVTKDKSAVLIRNSSRVSSNNIGVILLILFGIAVIIGCLMVVIDIFVK